MVALGAPWGIAANGDVLFWTTVDGKAVKQSPTGDGGATATFESMAPDAQGVPIAIAADSSGIYWTANGSVVRCDVGGCPGGPTQLAPGKAVALALDATSVYWADWSTNPGEIRMCGKGGCNQAATVLATTRQLPTSIATDAMSLYWTEAGPPPPSHAGAAMGEAAGGVYKCPVGGCNGAPTTISPNATAALGVAVDATHAYWVDIVQDRIISAVK